MTALKREKFRRMRARIAICALLAALPGCFMKKMAAGTFGGTLAGGSAMHDSSGLAAHRLQSKQPPPDWHAQRNRHNTCPRHEPLAGVVDCLGNVWARDNRLTSWLFHRDGWLGDRHRTYRSPEPGADGGFQCTYDRNRDLVLNGSKRGTYDYVRPDVSMQAHRDRDVRPHERWPGYYEDPDRTYVYDCADCGARIAGS
ncbi:MAG: hypothetical protein ACREEP_18435 [Dongiaceae bacterium]